MAQSFLQASLIGSTAERVARVRERIDAKEIRGVIITNMLGASHCSMETRLIQEMLPEIPILALDVPPPFGITHQIKLRIKAFMEMLQEQQE